MRFILGALVALLCAQAQSQTLYRCGKVYQDRPCDAGQAGRAVGSTSTAAPAAPSGPADAECAQRGKDSLKVVWSREGGASEERLVAEARSAADKRFVQDVYRRRGSASQVQAAVEADCRAEKAQLELDAAMAAAAAVRAQREGVPAPAAPLPVVPVIPVNEAPRPAPDQAEGKKRICAQYAAEMDELRSRERAGGSIQTMERLNESRRRLHARMSASGC